jgi:hypothetical protein
VKFAATLAASVLASASAVGAQMIVDPPVDQHPARDDATVEKMLSDAERDRVAGQSNDMMSRVEHAKLAGCLASKNPRETARVLAMDFTTATYNRALRMLAEEDRDCVDFRGALRTGNLLFAGELAEALVEQRNEPVANALAQAATAPATTSFSFTDRVAICVVRSVPSDVAKLFATERNSTEESAALEMLTTPLGLCAKAAEAKKPLSINPAGLRAMLASAAFRSVKDI